MERNINLVGQRFGRLKVLERAEDYVSPSGYKFKKWICFCDCGETVTVLGGNLKKGTRSCGCLRRELRKENGKWKGQSQELLHHVWSSMIRRCYVEADKSYLRYGAKGITVCDEWHFDYFVFKKWALDNGYKERVGLSIDRIDPNGNYTPENCRWTTIKMQNRNKRNTTIIEFNNEKHSLSDWAEILDINYNTLKQRIFQYHWSVESAFTTQPRPLNKPCSEEFHNA